LSFELSVGNINKIAEYNNATKGIQAFERDYNPCDTLLTALVNGIPLSRHIFSISDFFDFKISCNVTASLNSLQNNLSKAFYLHNFMCFSSHKVDLLNS
jgi:hypothetical protein